MPGNVPDGKSAHLFCIVMVRNRDKLMTYLQEHGIETAIHYDPIHLEPYFRRTYGYKKGDFPIAEHMGRHVLSLPLHAAITEGDVRYVVTKLAECAGPRRRPPNKA
jgi:dTDP-4-amino-4,6-dideoxygalactose transaminase